MNVKATSSLSERGFPRVVYAVPHAAYSLSLRERVRVRANLHVLLLLLLLLPTPEAHAQSITDPGQRFLEQEKRRKEQESLEKQPEEIEVAPPEAPQVKEGETCFTIHTITLEDAKGLSEKEQETLLLPYRNACMGISRINQLVYDITNAYIDKGYVTTRAYIPAQNLNQGALRLVVVPGVVERVVLNGNTLWKDRMRLMTALPGVKGSWLNLKTLEQGLDQMNRLASSGAALQLWPGEKAGGSRVEVTDTPGDSLRGYVSYDNGGQEETGKNRVTLGVEKDNLLGVNDSLALHYIGSKDTNALAFSGSVPYGYWTFSLDSSYSEYLSVIDSAAELFGTTWNHSLKADRVVWRGKETKTSLYGVLNLKESSRIINEVTLSPQPLTVARAGVTQLFRFPGQVLTLDAAYSQGLSTLGAVEDSAGAGSDTPRAQFHKLDGSFIYYHPFAATTLRSSLVWQYAFDTLYSSEQIIMGDSGTVRGFSGSGLSGDSGLYSRNELDFNAPGFLPPGDYTARPYVFLDGGHAGQEAGGHSGFLAGTGAGIRFAWKRLSGDIAAALPVVRSGAPDEGGFKVYTSISIALF